MKKVSLKVYSIFAASMLFAAAGVFVSCANGSSSSSKPDPKPAPAPKSATILDVAAVETSGSASVSDNKAILTASNGTYYLEQSQETNFNIAARNAAPEPTGTWKFIKNGDSKPTYTGSFTGSIKSIGSSEISLTLIIETFLSDGLVTPVVEEVEFEISIKGTVTVTFTATIPAVKVSSVHSYYHVALNAWRENGDINVGTAVEKFDLCDGVITYSAVGSDRGKQYHEDNSRQTFEGTYTIENNILTGIVNGKSRKFYFKEDGSLADKPDGEGLKPISGSYKVYVNAETKLDGENSYAWERIVWFKEDSGKTGQVMEFKKIIDNPNTTRNMTDITYEIKGNTVTLTGKGVDAGYSKTATISEDGKTLTLDGVTYLKL